VSYDPASSFKDYFQEQFFDVRNDIAHYGKIDFQKADGERSHSLATALINLLHAMDLMRIEAMDEAHKKALKNPPPTA